MILSTVDVILAGLLQSVVIPSSTTPLHGSNSYCIGTAIECLTVHAFGDVDPGELSRRCRDFNNTCFQLDVYWDGVKKVLIWETTGEPLNFAVEEKRNFGRDLDSRHNCLAIGLDPYFILNLVTTDCSSYQRQFVCDIWTKK